MRKTSIKSKKVLSIKIWAQKLNMQATRGLPNNIKMIIKHISKNEIY